MSQQAPPKFHAGQQALLLEKPLRNPARPALPVTVRAQSHEPADLQRPYVVTVDEGLCAGLKLCAAEHELSPRPA